MAHCSRKKGSLSLLRLPGFKENTYLGTPEIARRAKAGSGPLLFSSRSLVARAKWSTARAGKSSSGIIREKRRKKKGKKVLKIIVTQRGSGAYARDKKRPARKARRQET